MFLLTARPWAERGSCSARDLFFFCFFFLSVTRPEPPLGQIVIVTFNHAMCDVYSPKAVENVADIVFFIVSKVYFLLVSSKRSIQSEC